MNHGMWLGFQLIMLASLCVIYREQYDVLYSSIERSLVDEKMQNVQQIDAQGMPMCIMLITTVLSVQVQLPIS